MCVEGTFIRARVCVFSDVTKLDHVPNIENKPTVLCHGFHYIVTYIPQWQLLMEKVIIDHIRSIHIDIDNTHTHAHTTHTHTHLEVIMTQYCLA